MSIEQGVQVIKNKFNRLTQITKGTINFLSLSHQYSDPSIPGFTRFKNFIKSFFVKGLLGITASGAFDEVVSSNLSAHNCSATDHTDEQVAKCKEHVNVIGGFLAAPAIFLDSIAQIALDHPKIISKEKSESYSQKYNAIKDLVGNFSFYLLSAMAIAILMQQVVVSDLAFGLLEALPAVIFAIFSNARLRERIRISQGSQCVRGGEYTDNYDPRGYTARFSDGFFGFCIGGSIGRGVVATVQDVLVKLNLVAGADTSKNGAIFRWTLAAFFATTQGLADYLRSSAAPSNYQFPAGFRGTMYNTLFNFRQLAFAVLGPAYICSLVARMLRLMSPVREIQLSLTLSAVALIFIRSLLVSFNPQPVSVTSSLSERLLTHAAGAANSRHTFHAHHESRDEGYGSLIPATIFSDPNSPERISPEPTSPAPV